MEQKVIIKKLVQVVLDGESLDIYERFKKSQGLKNDSEVLRRAIYFAFEKQDK